LLTQKLKNLKTQKLNTYGKEERKSCGDVRGNKTQVALSVADNVV
jgi:hypothetical protein